MKPLYKLAIVLIPLGILIAAIPDNKVVVEKANPQQILAEIKDGSYLMTADVIADMLVKKDPALQLIDVRSQDEFDQFHLPGAINIPLDNLLSDENSALFDQEVKMNVLYSTGTTAAGEAWMLLRQQGYKSLYVLQGGVNYWAETILNPSQPSSAASDDELAKYDFRKAAGGVLGGGAPITATTSVSAPGPSAPKAGAAPKKKRAAGGC
jgi:sulfur-carrier protein adenylyltransferase/sulfurtransferase